MSPVHFRKKHHITSINFNGHSTNISFHDPNPEEKPAEQSTHIHFTHCPAVEAAVEQIMENAKREGVRINDRGFPGRITEIEVPLPNAARVPGSKPLKPGEKPENKRENILGGHLGRIGTLPIREIYYDKPQHTVSIRLPTEPISHLDKMAVLKGMQELDARALSPSTMSAARDFIFKGMQQEFESIIGDSSKVTIHPDYIDIPMSGSKYTDFRIEIRPSSAQRGKLMVKLTSAQSHYRFQNQSDRIAGAEAYLDEIIKHLKANDVKSAQHYPMPEGASKDDWERYSANGGGIVLVSETSMRDLVKALAKPLKDKEGSNVIPECFGDNEILEQLDDEPPSIEAEVEQVEEAAEVEAAADETGEGKYAKAVKKGSKPKTVIKAKPAVKKTKIVAKGGAKKTAKRR